LARGDNIEELDPDHRGAGLKVGIVVSRFNSEVGEGLLSSCTATLLKHGVAPHDRLQRSRAVQGNRVHRHASRARTNPAGVANWTMSSSGQMSAHVTSAVG